MWGVDQEAELVDAFFPRMSSFMTTEPVPSAQTLQSFDGQPLPQTRHGETPDFSRLFEEWRRHNSRPLLIHAEETADSPLNAGGSTRPAIANRGAFVADHTPVVPAGVTVETSVEPLHLKTDHPLPNEVGARNPLEWLSPLSTQTLTPNLPARSTNFLGSGPIVALPIDGFSRVAHQPERPSLERVGGDNSQVNLSVNEVLAVVPVATVPPTATDVPARAPMSVDEARTVTRSDRRHPQVKAAPDSLGTVTQPLPAASLTDVDWLPGSSEHLDHVPVGSPVVDVPSTERPTPGLELTVPGADGQRPAAAGNPVDAGPASHSGDRLSHESTPAETSHAGPSRLHSKEKSRFPTVQQQASRRTVSRQSALENMAAIPGRDVELTDSPLERFPPSSLLHATGMESSNEQVRETPRELPVGQPSSVDQFINDNLARFPREPIVATGLNFSAEDSGDSEIPSHLARREKHVPLNATVDGSDLSPRDAATVAATHRSNRTFDQRERLAAMADADSRRDVAATEYDGNVDQQPVLNQVPRQPASRPVRTDLPAEVTVESAPRQQVGKETGDVASRFTLSEAENHQSSQSPAEPRRPNGVDSRSQPSDPATSTVTNSVGIASRQEGSAILPSTFAPAMGDQATDLVPDGEQSPVEDGPRPVDLGSQPEFLTSSDSVVTSPVGGNSLPDVAPMQSGPPVERSLIDRVMAETLEHSVKIRQSGTETVEFLLDPPELGEMRIEMSRTPAGELSMRVTVQLPETHALLERHVRELSHSLVEQGITLGDLDLSSQQQQQGRDSPPQLHAIREGPATSREDAAQSLRTGGIPPSESGGMIDFVA